MRVLIFLSILGLGVYPILIRGWSSNSNYSLIGRIRALAQTISYEVSLVFILLRSLFICSSIRFYWLNSIQKIFFFALYFIPLLIWIFSIIAELNRTPFDFAEGERELVSGFNTEYRRRRFAIIFIAEYLIILTFRILTTVFFLGGKDNYPFFLLVKIIIIIHFIIWIRATLPRFRYDKLIDFSWKVILPFSTFHLFISIFLTITSKY